MNSVSSHKNYNPFVGASSSDILVGPYELFKENSNGKSCNRITMAITDNFSVQTRKYINQKHLTTEKENHQSLEDAMDYLEQKLTIHRKSDFYEKQELNDRQKQKKKEQEEKKQQDKIGKRLNRDASADSQTSQTDAKKRQNLGATDQNQASNHGSDLIKSSVSTSSGSANKQQEEKKKSAKSYEEEKKQSQADHLSQEPTRRSARNYGKDQIDYNIDHILAAADAAEMGDIDNGTLGGGCINVMLAQSYDPEKNDPTGWLMSEKLDGVRCYWNGSAMYTRNKNLFYPPDWFKDQLPKDLCLDGELWTKRGDFQKIVSIVRRQDKNEEWKNIKYMVYDAPKAKGNFKQRLKKMHEVIDVLNSDYIKVHPHVICKDVEHLTQELDKVTAAGGEGMMIKDPNSKYENKRSELLLKVKKFDDAEATVIGHQKGTGRCSDMCGAILMRGDDGIEFKIGSGFNDAQRRKPPKLGARVTYKYMGKSNAGKPRFPIFMRVHPGM